MCLVERIHGLWEIGLGRDIRDLRENLFAFSINISALDLFDNIVNHADCDIAAFCSKTLNRLRRFSDFGCDRQGGASGIVHYCL